jgi:hypothetical protein
MKRFTRLKIVLILSFCALLLAVYSEYTVARMLRPLQPSGAALFRDETINNLYFKYMQPPDPGLRVWMRTDDQTWAEVYPSGTVSRYRRIERIAIDGQKGTIVSKIAGKVRLSGTENDGSFQVFVPDYDCIRPSLMFRHLQNGSWSPWAKLPPATVIK